MPSADTVAGSRVATVCAAARRAIASSGCGEEPAYFLTMVSSFTARSVPLTR